MDLHSLLVIFILEWSRQTWEVTYFDIKADFFEDEGTAQFLQVNHHFRAGTVCFSKGSCNSAPGMSAGKSSTSGRSAIDKFFRNRSGYVYRSKCKTRGKYFSFSLCRLNR